MRGRLVPLLLGTIDRTDGHIGLASTYIFSMPPVVSAEEHSFSLKNFLRGVATPKRQYGLMEKLGHIYLISEMEAGII